MELPATDVAVLVGRAFEQLGIPYFVGGSVASSVLGQARHTNDIDIVAQLFEHQVAPLIDALGPDFDVDDEALREAARQRKSWNVFYTPLFVRIDLFISRGGDFERSELARRMRIELAPGATLYVQSPEDLVLRKLLWFRQGGETSERQLNDVVGVIRIQLALDFTYCEEWAARLGISDLLQRARAEARR
jgi:hypothetical protein